MDWYRQYVDETRAFELQYIKNPCGSVDPKVHPITAPVCHACTIHLISKDCSPVTTKYNSEAEDQLDVAFEFNSLGGHLDNMPNLQAISDTNDEHDGGTVDPDKNDSLGELEDYYFGSVGDILVCQVITVLTRCQPYPGDNPTVNLTY